MTHNAEKSPLSLLGLGAMGGALARAWLAAGHPLTVWNRTAGRAESLAREGAHVAATAAEAVAASDLVIVCLLDHASVDDALAGADLSGKDLVDLTTGTPEEARARARWAEERGARFLDGGVMAVPPMIGVPGSGAYVFYSGSRAVFEAHAGTLAAPAETVYTGEDPGLAALHDVALLSAMTGMFAGVAHAFALVREEILPKGFADLVVGWLRAMTPYAYGMAEHLDSGDYTKNVTSNLAMMVRGNATLLRTAEEQKVSPELLTPFMTLMERRLADGHADEGTTGVVDLLRIPRPDP
ncbi:NAD(P)-dependent oxidoreductase [Microbispora sp. CA-102843]|uniref:NAD(P)-dependent oxidoreductase n=1 Tax=Microbispora sp. CA-102843 TaxID=3239952 RepID=UPI003D94CB86